MATLTTLRNAVSKKLGLDNSVSGDQTLIDEWLNQAILEILLRTRCTVEEGTMTTVASTWTYQLDTGILSIIDLWREESDGSVNPCIREDYSEILSLHQGAGAASDSFVTHYAILGSNLLAIWPTPSSAYTIKLFYVPRPTVMSTGSDDPSSATFGRIPTEFHKAIEYYALAEGADYDDDQGSQHGDRYRFQFDQLIREMYKDIRRKGGTRLSPVVVNPRRRTRLPHDPSMDYRG